jgi:hypothetical protein
MPRRQKITELGLAKQQFSRMHSFSMNDAQVLKPFGLFREEGQRVSHIGMGQLKSWVGSLLESK